MTDEEWKKAKAECEDSLKGHDWREMSDNEAYPLPCGIVCKKCNTAKVGFSISGLKDC